MNKIVTVGIVLAAALAMVGCETMSAECVSSPAYRIENRKIVLDSPFALEIGSTEYAKAFGDLAIEIGYAEPRYAKRDGKYEITCKGAVVVNIVQSPVITIAKAKK